MAGARSALALVRLALAAVGGQDQPAMYARPWVGRYSRSAAVALALAAGTGSVLGNVDGLGTRWSV